MTIKSPQSFLALIQKSELLSGQDLEKVRVAAGKHDDAKSLARALAGDKVLTRWQAGQLLAGRSSFTLGKYHLLDLLGRGGMGSVFKAEHTTLHRRVALKIISKRTGRDPARLARFLDEARTIAALDHPNIVRAYDIDHEGERYFLVMEFVEGRDLQQMVESDGPLEVAQAAEYIRQAALGLAHAHDRKMIHCDIKPANLIVNGQQVVKILDMGMTRLVADDGSGSDSDANIVGTIDYMAPEQALESDDLDFRADIYSLGCTLYFLLTSRPPFAEGTLAQRIMRHQTQDPPPIGESRSGVPEELARVYLKMMAKNPEDRYQSGAEIAQALEPWSPADEEDRVGPAVMKLTDDDSTADKVDDDPVSITVSDTGSFSVRASSRRGRTARPAKKAAKTPKSADRIAGFFADPRKKWAVVIGSALLLLAGVVGGLAWFFGRDGDVMAADSATVAASSTDAAGHPTAPGVDLSSPDDPMAAMAAAFADPDELSGEVDSPDPADEMPTAASDPERASDPESQGDNQESPQPAEPKEPAEGDNANEEKPEPKPAEPKPAENEPIQVEALKDFPTRVNLPLLSDNDAAGEGSKTPMALGKIHGGSDVSVQLLLVGGEQALKGGRKFVIAKTDPTPGKGAWSILLAEDDSTETQAAAKLWRDGETLHFQWAEDASGAQANYLRNCFLQARVSGKSKYTALTDPVKAEPLMIDLLRGQSNGGAPLKYAPDSDLLRFRFSKGEHTGNVHIEPSEPVALKTPVMVNFVYKDRHENTSNAAVFRIMTTTRSASLGIDMRLINPMTQAFKTQFGQYNEQQLTAIKGRTVNQMSELRQQVGRTRGETAHKKNREIDALGAQLWYLEFFMRTHKKATIHYQVVADVGGRELVIVSSQ